MIIARGQTLESVRQRIFLIVRKFCERTNVRTRDYQGFKRPDCPEGYQNGEVLIFEDDPFVALPFEGQIVAEQARMLRRLVLLLRQLFLGGFIGQAGTGPDLTVRMGIAGAHHGPAILKDLNVIDEVARAQLPRLFRTKIDHRAQFLQRHARNSQVVARRKAEHTTDSSLAARHEQAVYVKVAPWSVRK